MPIPSNKNDPEEAVSPLLNTPEVAVSMPLVFSPAVNNPEVAVRLPTVVLPYTFKSCCTSKAAIEVGPVSWISMLGTVYWYTVSGKVLPIRYILVPSGLI